MIPRKDLDIGWSDFLFALGACFRGGKGRELCEKVERIWDSEGRGVVFQSLRSGFDLLLEAMAWPRGSEVLVSAVNIRDMIRILAEKCEGRRCKFLSPSKCGDPTSGPIFDLLPRRVPPGFSAQPLGSTVSHWGPPINVYGLTLKD